MSVTYDAVEIDDGATYMTTVADRHSPAPRRLDQFEAPARAGGVYVVLPPAARALKLTGGIFWTGTTKQSFEDAKDALLKVLARNRKRLALGPDGRFIVGTPTGLTVVRQTLSVMEWTADFVAEDAYFASTTPSGDVRAITFGSGDLAPGETTVYVKQLSLAPGGSAPAPVRVLIVNQAGSVTPTLWTIANRTAQFDAPLPVAGGIVLATPASVAASTLLCVDALTGEVWTYGLSSVTGFWPLEDAAAPCLDFSGNSRDLYRRTALCVGAGATTRYRLDETSGTSAADAIGTATGTYTAGYTLGQAAGIATEGGSAVALNGSTGYVAIGANSALLIETSDFSFDGWVYLNSAGTQTLFGGDLGAPGLLVVGGKLRLDKLNVVGGTTGNATLATGQWYHVAVVFDSTAVTNNCTYYVNGALDTTVTFNNDFSVGAYIKTLGQFGTGALYLNGTIDDFAFYKGVKLSAAQITELYNAGRSAAAALRADGPPHGAVAFDGTGVLASTAAAFGLTADITVAAWVYPTVTGTAMGIAGKAGSNAGYVLRKTAADVFSASVGNGAATRTATGTTTIQANHWYHVALTFKQSTGTLSLYVDGVLEAQTAGGAFTPSASTNPLRVGGPHNASGSIEYWTGRIARPAVLAAQLSATQVRALMRRGLWALGSQADLYGAFPPLDPQAGTTNVWELRVDSAAGAPAIRMATAWRPRWE